MKKIYFILLVSLLNSGNSKLKAQVWEDETFAYDSVMNIAYGSATDFSGTTRTLYLDLFLPDCGTISGNLNRPLLLVIHGGAFLAGDKSESRMQTLCRKFAKKGYVTATVNYRLGMVSDDTARTCNFPNYSCVSSTDPEEWYRACHRGIQDVKGALRYLLNRKDQYGINPMQVFTCGESAGGFIALGAGLYDLEAERMPYTQAISDAPMPHATTNSCTYNVGISTASPFARPDLGSIEGDIELSAPTYQILGIGNFYGGMMTNWLTQADPNKPKPAIYSFHRPCDMVVPVDSGHVFEGQSWCFTNGYGCNAINNTPIVYGTRAIQAMNNQLTSPYTMDVRLTSVEFPYSFLIGTGSCADQVNNACHAFDNFEQRYGEMAAFFANILAGTVTCATTGIKNTLADEFGLHPQPSTGKLYLKTPLTYQQDWWIYGLDGKVISEMQLNAGQSMIELPQTLSNGSYLLRFEDGSTFSLQLLR